MDPRGRSCPLAYRYQPEALAQPAQLEADTLYGDFHWLDIDPEGLPGDQPGVLAHHATKGNVEAELASEESEEDVGCGCAYPDYVGDDVVERSNQIIGRLRATAARFPELVDRLGALPRYLTASVAGPCRHPPRRSRVAGRHAIGWWSTTAAPAWATSPTPPTA